MNEVLCGVVVLQGKVKQVNLNLLAGILFTGLNSFGLLDGYWSMFSRLAGREMLYSFMARSAQEVCNG